MIEHAAQIETVKWPDYWQGTFHLIAIFNSMLSPVSVLVAIAPLAYSYLTMAKVVMGWVRLDYPGGEAWLEPANCHQPKRKIAIINQHRGRGH